MAPLPVLLSIPHGGWRVPPEVEAAVALTHAQILEDNDAFTLGIYDLGGEVLAVAKTEVARAVLDLNRRRDDRPPGNPDGVVKSNTCTGRTVYRSPPDAPAVESLLRQHYDPYHGRLRELAGTPGLRLGLDCHSMAPTAPAIAPDPGQARPAMCLSDAGGTSCPRDVIDRLEECMRRSFGLREGEVTRNRPFRGGYITRSMGGRPVPWVQVELNRALYLRDPWFDPASGSIDGGRLLELRSAFREGLRQFFAAEPRPGG
ncbi:MAG TPA: N-formylglutamate amidohydrolase [Candidatus Thermoplasmatota archaeon]